MINFPSPVSSANHFPAKPPTGCQPTSTGRAGPSSTGGASGTTLGWCPKPTACFKANSPLAKFLRLHAIAVSEEDLRGGFVCAGLMGGREQCGGESRQPKHSARHEKAPTRTRLSCRVSSPFRFLMSTCCCSQRSATISCIKLATFRLT